MKYFTLSASAAALYLSCGAALADATSYPLTIENCGHALTFEHAPQRTVTVGQSTTEILYTLGLAQTVAGTSVWFNEVLPEYREVDAGIARLADNDPSFESVLNKKPGLVTVSYEWHVGPEGIVATRESFHDVAIPTYVMLTDCLNKDNSQGIDGTRADLYSNEALYQSILELAAIYDIQDRGAEVVADLRATEGRAVAKARALDLPEGTSGLFWFSSAEMDIDPYVAGKKGVPAYMMSKLGVENVVTPDEEWPTVGWETLAKADPTFIVLADLTRRRFPADDVKKKLEFLNTDPVAREMTAVKEGRLIILDAHSMDPSIRIAYSLEQLADKLAEFDLK